MELNRHQTRYSRFLFPVLLVLGPCLAAPVAAQIMGSEYNIKQFCEEPLFSQANPLRKTILYLDEGLVWPKSVGPRPSASESDLEEWQEDVLDAMNGTNWFQQLSGKLEGSLMPSEPVSVVAVDSTGSPSVRDELCWPGYTPAQEEAIKNRSLVSSWFTSDPMEDLRTQRRVFFGAIRKAMATDLGIDAAKSKNRNFVRTLLIGEKDLRSKGNEFIRVLWLGDMLEKSEFIDLSKVESIKEARKVAEDLVDRTRVSFGGVSFHIFGVADKALTEESQAFWGRFLGKGRGQLASFGKSLAITAEMPTNELKLSLEASVPQESVGRRGRAVLLTSNDGQIVEGSIALAGRRSALEGQFRCDGESADRCNANCTLDAESRFPILFLGPYEHKVNLQGPANQMTGFIGDADDGRPDRAFAPLAAKVEGCE